MLATSSEMGAPTSTKYVAEQCIMMPDGPKTFQGFWLHSSIFPLEKHPKNLKF